MHGSPCYFALWLSLLSAFRAGSQAVFVQNPAFTISPSRRYRLRVADEAVGEFMVIVFVKVDVVAVQVHSVLAELCHFLTP